MVDAVLFILSDLHSRLAVLPMTAASVLEHEQVFLLFLHSEVIKELLFNQKEVFAVVSLLMDEIFRSVEGPDFEVLSAVLVSQVTAVRLLNDFARFLRNSYFFPAL